MSRRLLRSRTTEALAVALALHLLAALGVRMVPRPEAPSSGAWTDAGSAAEVAVVVDPTPAAAERAAELRTSPAAAGRTSAVVAAAVDGPRGADAPAFGIAVFSVAIGSDGNVQVDLKDASTTGWDALRPAIQSELSGKAIRIPPNSRGLRVDVRVEASEQFPGGARPPKKAGATASASGVHVVESGDKITFTVPQVSLGYRGRKCAVGVTLAPGAIGAGAGCEAGVAMRVVAARILNEERF